MDKMFNSGWLFIVVHLCSGPEPYLKCWLIDFHSRSEWSESVVGRCYQLALSVLPSVRPHIALQMQSIPSQCTISMHGGSFESLWNVSDVFLIFFRKNNFLPPSGGVTPQKRRFFGLSNALQSIPSQRLFRFQCAMAHFKAYGPYQMSFFNIFSKK